MINFLLSYILLSLTLVRIAYAQAINNVFDFQGLLFDLLNKLTELLWVASIAVFFWGLVKFIKNANDSAEHEKGKQFIIWGIVSFLVLVSLWGIVHILLIDTLGLGLNTPVDYIDAGGTHY